MWEGFKTSVRRPLQEAGIPLLPAMGNHAASSQRSQGRWIYARERQQASQFWNRHQDALPPELTEADNFPFQHATAWTWSFPRCDGCLIGNSEQRSAAMALPHVERTARQKDDLCLVVGSPLTAFSQPGTRWRMHSRRCFAGR